MSSVRTILKKINWKHMRVPTYSILANVAILITKAIHDLSDVDQDGFSSKAFTVAATGAYMNLAVTCYAVVNALLVTKNNCADYYFCLDHSEYKDENTENQLIEHPSKHAMLNAALNGVYFSCDYSTIAGMIQSLIKLNLIAQKMDNSFIPTSLGVPIALSSSIFIANQVGKCQENRFRKFRQRITDGEFVEEGLREEILMITQTESSIKRYAASDRNMLIYRLGILFMSAVLLMTELLDFGNREKDGYTLKLLI